MNELQKAIGDLLKVTTDKYDEFLSKKDRRIEKLEAVLRLAEGEYDCTECKDAHCKVCIGFAIKEALKKQEVKG